MKRDSRKIISKSLTFILVVFVMLHTVSFAGLIPEANPLNADVGGMETRVNTILAAVQYVGYSVALGMLIWVGVRYTMAPANERADLKSGSIKYIAGAIIVFSASTLFPVIFEEFATWTGG